MAADADDDVTPTTVTVSEHDLGHGHLSFQSHYTRRRMMRACGADDAEVFSPADVQKTTFSDDR
jgi:hypothetical protein